MSGDWIKVESATPDKPEIWIIAEHLDIDPDAVFGKLFRVWVWFDEHTEDGNAPSVTKKILDRLVGVTGFCDSMLHARWMLEQDGIISLPNFDKHNGVTAKKRANTAKRVANHRNKGGSNANETLKPKKSNAQGVTDALAKEEKRREEVLEDKSSNNMSEKNSDYLDFARGMFPMIRDVVPKSKEPKYENWANDIRLMHEIDGYALEEMANVFRFANKDSFWKTNICSPAKLRKHYAELHAKMINTIPSGQTKTTQSNIDAANKFLGDDTEAA